jgi:hypothetical protein
MERQPGGGNPKSSDLVTLRPKEGHMEYLGLNRFLRSETGVCLGYTTTEIRNIKQRFF